MPHENATQAPRLRVKPGRRLPPSKVGRSTARSAAGAPRRCQHVRRVRSQHRAASACCRGRRGRSAGCEFPAGRTSRAPGRAPRLRPATARPWAALCGWAARCGRRFGGRRRRNAPVSFLVFAPGRLTRARAPRPCRAACAPCGGAPSRCCTRRRVAAARRALQQPRRGAGRAIRVHRLLCSPRRRADVASRAAAQTGMASESVHVDFEAFQARAGPCALVRPFRSTPGPAVPRGRSGAARCRPAVAGALVHRAGC